MKLLQFSALAATVASVAFAQSPVSATSAAGSPSATTSGTAATHTVKVGYPIGKHAFSPENTVANLGDTILFEMYPANHSVVRMDPESPCIPFDKAGHASNELWWSGFYDIKDAKNPGTYDIVVDTTDPIWFYCSAVKSCKVYSMVGAINMDNSTNNLESVKLAATQVDFSLSPGEDIPPEGGSVPGATTTTTSAAISNSNNHGSSSLSTGAIAGIVIGAIGAFALVGLLFFLVGRKKKSVEHKEKAAAEAEAAGRAQQDPNPPMYHDPTVDPRHSMIPGSPLPTNRDTYHGGKPEHQSLIPDHTSASGFEERHPHRMSELPSQNYDPVEIYTPGSEHTDPPTSRGR